MQEFSGTEARMIVSTILRKLADRIEQDDGLALWLHEELLKLTAPAKKEHAKKPPSTKKAATDQPIELSQLFAVLSASGAGEVTRILEQHELEVLRKFVVSNGLDPSQKVRRWRVQSKVVHYIVGMLEQKMSQGKAFMDGNG